MNITCKAVKIHNFSARDFVTCFLICAGGTEKSLASFPTAEDHTSILSRKSANLILKPILISGFILNVLLLVQLTNYRLTGLILSRSVFGPLVNVVSHVKLYLL